MKTFIRRSITVFVIVFALLGLGGTVAFASGYIEWAGTKDYLEALDNLEGIELSIGKLQDLVVEKDNEIQNLEEEKKEEKTKHANEMEELKTTLAQSKTDNAALSGENESIKEEKRELENKHSNLLLGVGTVMTNTNEANGKGNKFDAMQSGLNDLASTWGIEQEIKSPNGNGPVRTELNQAEEDMGHIREKTESLKESLHLSE